MDSPVHPRRGGEHTGNRGNIKPSAGSSPQRRGTRGNRALLPRARRFIPAEAGNTHAPRSGPRRSPVHPRRGGEHNHRGTSNTDDPGSSPQRRGTPSSSAARPPAFRFIPAEAGNTYRQAMRISSLPVHPRRGGEHKDVWLFTIFTNGSSPQRRGTHRKPGEHQAEYRFIPAEAGNTPTAGNPAQTTPVHPRRGGEHTFRLPFHSVENGSSPQRRGTRFARITQANDLRFIPAEAGNTV